jgi:hypothetical protein
MNETEPTVKGWYRASKRQRWRLLSEANDYGAALNALLDAVATLPSGELLVSQRDPNQCNGIGAAYSERRHNARTSRITIRKTYDAACHPS